ncbi:MAG: N-acetylmuramic acid 6-phosphate etherase [Clostridiaceae bacterium]
MISERKLSEQRNENTVHIDRVDTIDILRLLNNEDKLVPGAVEKELQEIAKAVEAITITLKNGGRLFYVGAGTSGRLGVMDAAENFSAYGIEEDKIIALIAGGTEALKHSVGFAQDNKFLSVEELRDHGLSDKDLVLCISASGTTPYVIGALEYARNLGAKSILLTSVTESEVGQLADIKIAVIVGPEAIAGSSRLKSASAHKMVLNMISTGVMIKLGRIYKNLMVEVKPNNAKLRKRRKTVICEAVGVDDGEAENLLNLSGGNTKLAIVMGITKLDRTQAELILDECDGNIKTVLDKLGIED